VAGAIGGKEGHLVEAMKFQSLLASGRERKEGKNKKNKEKESNGGEDSPSGTGSPGFGNVKRPTRNAGESGEASGSIGGGSPVIRIDTRHGNVFWFMFRSYER